MRIFKRRTPKCDYCGEPATQSLTIGETTIHRCRFHGTYTVDPVRGPGYEKRAQ